MDKSFASMLKMIFDQRMLEIKSYSLRKFSKDINMPSSRISDYFAGKRVITKKAAQKILNSPSFNEQEMQKIQSSFKLSFEKQYHVKVLPIQSFEKINDPICFALLSFFDSDNEVKTPENAARQLGTNIETVLPMIESLIALNILEKIGDKYIVNVDRVESTFDVSDSALRSSHKQSLKRIAEQIDLVSLDRRESLCITLSLDPKKIKFAQKKIRHFAYKLAKELESGEKKEVYELVVQLFPWRSV